MWAYVAMGSNPEGRVLAQLDARVEVVASRRNQQGVANLTWA